LIIHILGRCGVSTDPIFSQRTQVLFGASAPQNCYVVMLNSVTKLRYPIAWICKHL